MVSDGELKVMTRTTSVMTWIEEWVFISEFIYGKSLLCWKDFEKAYGLSQKPLRCVLRQKLSLILAARRNWPMYATVEEDLALRNDATWNRHFPANQ